MRSLDAFLPRAEALAEQGLLYEYVAPLLATVALDPAIATVDLFVPWLHPAHLEFVGHARQLLAVLKSRWPAVARILVRLDGSAVWPGPSKPYITYLWKTPNPTRPTGHFDIRVATAASEWHFVHRALGRALVNGYSAGGYSPDTQAIDDYVAATFDPVANPRIRAIVAFEHDRPVGHATWSEGEIDEISGRQFDELIDLLVLDEAAGRGFGPALLAAAESAAVARGATLLGNVVAERDGEHSRAIVRRLVEDGWVPYYTVVNVDTANNSP